MLDKLYARVLRHAASPHAPLWLAALAFAEASFFPLPPETLLVPMVLAQKDKAWRYAAICTVASVAGGLLGWLIGALLLDTLAKPIVHFYHAEHTLVSLQEKFRQWGVWIILFKGLTPIPYKFVTIASGMAHFAILPFMCASLVTRGVRFALVAGLLRRFGPSIQDFLETRLPLVTGVFALALLGGFLALRYL
ncbi:MULTISPECIES: YqaA family protein [Acetobacter]|jgi:membrane protein YqaA with SNARE-associated domain|uniref:Membrane protein YqaA with SNARE-associated domain n=1 Tax=Acetobacter lovaniensis TaxID=104100 RepID=A0A841QD75_9PROT|nr:YqaA family protein [Acetobacter lovaniensis]MBB6456400.1 membrane protein YqaA with SNARE-associated domain [Acetobacter lovaniensis]MCI1698691.1 DedA family protein [Acetobacter lovaniensis]MCP1240875.1 DedA family protein [Acetobacter lovaniensis]NHN80766.1 DedA family protein [Acetobacter lovaniensis]GBQ73794.1 alkaline phosphatase [Acetobacter lovaniensis NRIC 0474]